MTTRVPVRMGDRLRRVLKARYALDDCGPEHCIRCPALAGCDTIFADAARRHKLEGRVKRRGGRTY